MQRAPRGLDVILGHKRPVQWQCAPRGVVMRPRRGRHSAPTPIYSRAGEVWRQRPQHGRVSAPINSPATMLATARHARDTHKGMGTLGWILPGSSDSPIHSSQTRTLYVLANTHKSLFMCHVIITVLSECLLCRRLAVVSCVMFVHIFRVTRCFVVSVLLLCVRDLRDFASVLLVVTYVVWCASDRVCVPLVVGPWDCVGPPWSWDP